ALSSRFSEGEVGRVTGRDFYVPNAIPVFGGAGSGATAGANGKSRNFYDMHAKQSRLILDTETPSGSGPALKAHLEMDFLSSAQGNENVTNGYSPELRQAYFSYGNWMAGQAWTTFQDLGALPDTIDFVGAADGTVFGRQPQVRYSTGPWQFSVENSQTVTGTSASATGTESNDNSVPDLVARYTHKGGFGHLSLAVLGRQLKNKDNTVSDTASGYGISLSGKLKAVGQDDVRFMLTQGRGIGRYVGLNSANDAIINAGELDLIDITAGYVTYRHVWNERLRSSLQVSGMRADNPASASADATKQVYSGLANLIYNVTPKLEVGVEAIHAKREVEGGAEGSMDRLQFMAKHSF
ncbi:MAG: DcaP family trimeric outer membrane transporter, partial [Perlucidibaca sp.]